MTIGGPNVLHGVVTSGGPKALREERRSGSAQGSGPSFLPNDTEAVWELAEHRYVFIEVRPEHAGCAMHTIFLDDFDARVREMAGRGIEPALRETYGNGVRKATYRDPDGNEIGFGGAPLAAPTE